MMCRQLMRLLTLQWHPRLAFPFLIGGRQCAEQCQGRRAVRHARTAAGWLELPMIAARSMVKRKIPFINDRMPTPYLRPELPKSR
jgi:hypothetical protein